MLVTHVLYVVQFFLIKIEPVLIQCCRTAITGCSVGNSFTRYQESPDPAERTNNPFVLNKQAGHRSAPPLNYNETLTITNYNVMDPNPGGDHKSIPPIPP